LSFVKVLADIVRRYGLLRTPTTSLIDGIFVKNSMFFLMSAIFHDFSIVTALFFSFETKGNLHPRRDHMD